MNISCSVKYYLLIVLFGPLVEYLDEVSYGDLCCCKLLRVSPYF